MSTIKLGRQNTFRREKGALSSSKRACVHTETAVGEGAGGAGEKEEERGARAPERAARQKEEEGAMHRVGEKRRGARATPSESGKGHRFSCIN